VSETYRKTGRVVRRENDWLVRVEEAGQAVEDAGIFTCEPIGDRKSDLTVDTDAVNEAADAIARLVRPPLILERLIVSEGVAEHEFGETRWTDRTRRVHVAVTHAPHRALIDLADFSFGVIERVVAALPRIRGSRTVDRVRLAPNVGAALLPALAGQIAMQQWAAPHDGKGGWIANVPVSEELPPNWFRPSYRSRPRRAWFHLRVEPLDEIDRDLPEAIALLGPIHDRTMYLLGTHGDDVFAATVPMRSIAGAAPAAEWYPYAAGCFGAELVM
jgi:hypothetical protein